MTYFDGIFFLKNDFIDQFCYISYLGRNNLSFLGISLLFYMILVSLL